MEDYSRNKGETNPSKNNEGKFKLTSQELATENYLQLPDGSKLMRTIVQLNFCEILNMVARDITTLPDPPTNAERPLDLICGKIIAFKPDQLTATAS
ncbi:hypothetical protein O181_013760 [Austropuccinia psidii MF-1]|uniref:Uncharacterized protein n=1 Tax=Austropuccinia psidii MF-1 TaxID=1389203 RepID=A0A9Q3C0J3_9BASI|nr:hypothetical protein [Austropuccinia psidii MF-1]